MSNKHQMMESDLMDLSSLRVSPLEEDEHGDFAEEVEQEESYDDEEDEDGVEVTLGFVEKPLNSRKLLRHHFPSKAGGVPAWLDPVDLPSERSFTCGFCGNPLQFLLQIYAPISYEYTFHRMLYVFMCPSMSCLLRDQHEQGQRRDNNHLRSVKIFRCQLPRSNPFYSNEPPKSIDEPLTSGVPLCCWCGAWKGNRICSGCNSARYCSTRHQSMHWPSGHKNECCRILSSSNVSKSTMNRAYASSSLWPEYEIIIEDESTVVSEIVEDNSSLTSLEFKNDNIDETFQVLSDTFEGGTDKQVWASFQERVTKAPEQVLRYCRNVNAKPLWPLSTGRPSNADIPKCKYCKGPLSFEFQIMPQLLFYFGVKNDPESLDWGTIVAYACRDSCNANISYKEEFAWVQLYPTSPLF